MGIKGDEDKLLQWLRRRVEASSRRLLGDDGAVLSEGGPWVVTMDTQIAGVHFPADLDCQIFARRLLAVNLSDLAAMGARPAYAFLALAAPPAFNYRRFFASFLTACRRYGVALAGGDLARSPNLLGAVTLLGRAVASGRWLTRNGARPGERIWVGGSLGESAAGQVLVTKGARMSGGRVVFPGNLTFERQMARVARRAVRRHLIPEPQLELGAWLARRRRGAAMDISDGLGKDLHRLCRESSVGAEIDLQRLPSSPGFSPLCHRLNRDPLELILGGGEDYVLLFTLPEEETPPARLGCHAIGRTTKKREVLLRSEGAIQPLPTSGWDHLNPDDPNP